MVTNQYHNTRKQEAEANKYIEHDPSKLIITSIREKGTDKYKKAHMLVIATELSRSQEQEHSASRTFVRLIVLD